MKVITEMMLRDELKATSPPVYNVPEGTILSPAAKEYLQGLKIDILFEKDKKAAGSQEASPKEEKVKCCSGDSVETIYPASEFKVRYKDYESGAAYDKKPEHMTQLFGNMLVDKNHARIRYRGKLDRLQAEIINAQCTIEEKSGNEALIKDLSSVLDATRELMRCEVLDEPFELTTVIGLTHDELRERSHNPMKFYKIKQMLLPDKSLGAEYAILNLIRTSIRETEVVAVDAFKKNGKLERSDIIQELNRLSSALHIIMCKYLAGEYSTKFY